MYAVLDNKLKIVAVHDEYDVVDKFISQQTNAEDLSIVKVKKKAKKQIENMVEYSEKYLTRYGDKYVPYYLYETLKETDGQYLEDLMYCKDILYRLLEDHSYNKGYTKAIQKVLKIIEDETNTPTDLGVLEKLHEMNKMYKERL